MHEYSLTNHDRKKTYYLLAIASGIVGAWVSFTLEDVSEFTGIVLAAPSGVVIFGLLFLVFDNFIWKFSYLYKLGIVKVPNLNGSWDAVISSSSSQNNVISAKLHIFQTYTKIRIRLESDKSHSLSQMAKFYIEDPQFFKLRYEYIAEFQESPGKDILRHYGVTNIALKNKEDELETKHQATYYTELGRGSNGSIEISRS